MINSDEIKLEDLQSISQPDKRVDFSFGSNTLQTKFKYEPGAETLILIFHGAVDKSSRKIPVFNPFFPTQFPSHQLSVFDSSLNLQGEQSVCWFAGSEQFRMQSELPAFFERLSDALAVKRVVFTGTSGGGFASLFYSWHLPNSIALVGCPQINLFEYYPRHVSNYVKACWPSQTAQDELRESVTTDLRDLYSKRFHNTVIYLQSSGDEFHLKSHLARFLPALSPKFDGKFILEVSYWGVWGHSRSVPLPVFSSWLQAIALSEELSAESLLIAKSSLEDRLESGTEKVSKTQETVGDNSESRKKTADLLRDYHLRHAKGA